MTEKMQKLKFLDYCNAPENMLYCLKGGILMNTSIQLYRRRHIPQECILLKGDRILSLDDTRLVTGWNTLNPRTDFASGISVYDFAKHWKITRLLRADGSLLYWYCDIMKMHIEKESSTYTMEDLLIDVILYPDGSTRVLDLDEAADAFDRGLITAADLSLALRSANELLNLIQSGGFAVYQKLLTGYETARG